MASISWISMFCDEVGSNLGIVTGVSRYDRKVFFVVVVCMYVHNMFILYAFQGFFFFFIFFRVWQLFDGESSSGRNHANHSSTDWPATRRSAQHTADEEGWRGESTVCVMRESVRVTLFDMKGFCFAFVVWLFSEDTPSLCACV